MNPQPEPFRITSSIIRATLPKLVKHPNQYLADEDLANLNIVCSDLDIQSGRASDGGLRLSSLYPRTNIRQIPVANLYSLSTIAYVRFASARGIRPGMTFTDANLTQDNTKEQMGFDLWVIVSSLLAVSQH